MNKQSLIKGTVVLGLAGIISKFLGLFFRWPLQMLIGDEGVGYYQMSFPLYMFFIAAASGIPVAVSKMVSERNAVGDYEGIVQVLRKSILLMFILGTGFTAVLLIFSNPIIHFLKWDRKSYYSLVAIAFAPMFISIMSAFRGFFQGLQNMNYTAVSQIIEQIGRVIVGVGLAYLLLPRGIEYSAGGAAMGAAAGGLFGGIYLIIKYFHVRKEIDIFKVEDNRDILSRLLYIAVPISLGAAVSSIMSLIDSALVPQKLLEAGFTYKNAAILYGQLTGKAFIMINVPLTVSAALCSSLMPIIAESHILNRNSDVMNKVDLAFKLSMVIAIPSMLGLYTLAYPILDLIFPGQSAGSSILQYSALSIPFIILVQTSTAVLQGIGHYIRPVFNLSLGCIVKIIITLFLVPIPWINIYGAILGSTAGYGLTCVLNILFLTKRLKININYFETMIKPAFASIFMIIAVVIIYLYVYNYTVSIRVACFLGMISGLIIYVPLVIVFGIFKYDYIKHRFLRK
ncbi:putative polysaccharide biosynthesis protein [Clostridium luticellarii]|jgi:stage V sporulation protein B|uniref:Stage V sporulation protein B n=1 Tax=Clostridium luticellarii TaxID=1691940 RepID=A0A2T0BNZ0_9CLOT|nr:polysaccharide biosynthesis protein [Clostridium luticellarii]MCI1944595.1 polysaccharide biosynthesis protein [Clostridium luticellarii]MCI1968094.1 polysaccharide biosynthesis protein [Clostridium luticellarii]MCI1994793.1 polysaccharide biosynthesis protein [Clostridium luticellarii]MCI2039025.1 polysaccharide biosynthesis protein [Clostridium luticellarii]PRR85599.1 Stage V sporulation protein B [Clostridium luticellarii]